MDSSPAKFISLHVDGSLGNLEVLVLVIFAWMGREVRHRFLWTCWAGVQQYHLYAIEILYVKNLIERVCACLTKHTLPYEKGSLRKLVNKVCFIHRDSF
ncbi:hypothetical protein VNO78_35898 [Psophocarpus tetragonolobus]|uniref:Uncharacterized protein n=1 Tax=Psophocarpus tetragonolobus TaxID=3891 RepID=A0AAN9NMI8_PSOTE